MHKVQPKLYFAQYTVSPNSELHSAISWETDQHFPFYSSTACTLCCDPTRGKKKLECSLFHLKIDYTQVPLIIIVTESRKFQTFDYKLKA